MLEKPAKPSYIDFGAAPPPGDTVAQDRCQAGVLRAGTGSRVERTHLHVVSWRLVDWHERGPNRSGWQFTYARPIGRCKRADRHCTACHAQRGDYSWRRQPEKFLLANTAPIMGGTGCPERRARLFHPDYCRCTALGRAIWRNTIRGGLLGEDQTGPAQDNGGDLRRLDHCFTTAHCLCSQQGPPTPQARTVFQA